MSHSDHKAVFRPLFLLVACTLCDFLFIYHCRPLWGEVGVEYNIWVSSPAGTQIHGVNSRSWFSSFYRIKLLIFASQQRLSITLGQYLAPQSLHFFFFYFFFYLILRQIEPQRIQKHSIWFCPSPLPHAAFTSCSHWRERDGLCTTTL